MYGDIRNYELAAKELYVNSLLFPEKYSAKIPGPLPISSATASIRDNFTITPNINGKFLLIIDPFSKTYKLWNNNDLDGQGTGTPTTGTFDINSNIVDQFRLVSCSVILRYYGNFNQMSGIFVSATNSDLTGNYQKYTNFNKIEDLTNKFISKSIDGVKLVYVPMDNRAIEFRPVSTYTSDDHPCKGQYLFIISGDLLPNTNSIRVDFYRNIEYTTNPDYREYILQSKSIPCNYEIPMLSSTITNAPSVVNQSSNYNNNNVAYGLRILDFLNGKGINMSPKFLI